MLVIKSLNKTTLWFFNCFSKKTPCIRHYSQKINEALFCLRQIFFLSFTPPSLLRPVHMMRCLLFKKITNKNLKVKKQIQHNKTQLQRRKREREKERKVAASNKKKKIIPHENECIALDIELELQVSVVYVNCYCCCCCIYYTCMEC